MNQALDFRCYLGVFTILYNFCVKKFLLFSHRTFMILYNEYVLHYT